MSKRLNNFLCSGFYFDEDEDLLKFKFKMINSILIIIAFFSTLFAILSDLGLNDLGTIHTKVDYLYGFATLMLIFYLRLSKENYFNTSHILILISLMTFTSALVFVVQDEFRMIWFYLIVFVAYALNGNASGIFYTISSIAVILTAHLSLDLQLSQIAINSVILGLVIGSFLFRAYTKKIADYEESLRKKNEDLKVLASTDGLTGIMNKRIFNEVSERYFETAQRDGQDLTLLLLDLDHFKDVNDTYGHQLGDQLLIHFTQTISSLLRKSDIMARIGGEEFVILLFKTNTEDALFLAETIREAISKIAIACEAQDKTISVTTSVGISKNRRNDEVFDEIFERSDKALYQAKSQGRNQTCLLK